MTTSEAIQGSFVPPQDRSQLAQEEASAQEVFRRRGLEPIMSLDLAIQYRMDSYLPEVYGRVQDAARAFIQATHHKLEVEPFVGIRVPTDALRVAANKVRFRRFLRSAIQEILSFGPTEPLEKLGELLRRLFLEEQAGSYFFDDVRSLEAAYTLATAVDDAIQRAISEVYQEDDSSTTSKTDSGFMSFLLQ